MRCPRMFNCAYLWWWVQGELYDSFWMFIMELFLHLAKMDDFKICDLKKFQATRKICGAVKSGVREFTTTGFKIMTGSAEWNNFLEVFLNFIRVLSAILFAAFSKFYYRLYQPPSTRPEVLHHTPEPWVTSSDPWPNEQGEFEPAEQSAFQPREVFDDWIGEGQHLCCWRCHLCIII